MSKMRKIRQLKTYYVCRCCKQPFAVIVALRRGITQQTYNRDKQGYDIRGYSRNPSKILYCTKCGTTDLRGYKYQRFLRKAYKMWPYWKNEFSAPSLHLIRDEINKNNNIREAEAFEQEKAARESSAGNGDQESVSAEVRESSDADRLSVLRVQRIGR